MQGRPRICASNLGSVTGRLGGTSREHMVSERVGDLGGSVRSDVPAISNAVDNPKGLSANGEKILSFPKKNILIVYK